MPLPMAAMTEAAEDIFTEASAIMEAKDSISWVAELMCWSNNGTTTSLSFWLELLLLLLEAAAAETSVDDDDSIELTSGSGSHACCRL
jgi:hypothetical protein